MDRDLVGEALLDWRHWLQKSFRGSASAVADRNTTRELLLSATVFRLESEHTLVLTPELDRVLVHKDSFCLPYSKFAVATEGYGMSCVEIFVQHSSVCVHRYILSKKAEEKHWLMQRPMEMRLIFLDGHIELGLGLLRNTQTVVPEDVMQAILFRMVSSLYRVCSREEPQHTMLPIRSTTQRKQAWERICKGKLPLWEWKTVVIEPSEVGPAPYKGGTHASPREHDRRGHFRTYKKTGRQVWIHNMVVGNKALGRVDHDYVIK